MLKQSLILVRNIKKESVKASHPPPLKIITSQDYGYHCYSNQEQVPDQFQTILKMLIHYIGPTGKKCAVTTPSRSRKSEASSQSHM